MNSTFISDAIEPAREMGLEHGKSKGSWVIDGNSSKEFCDKLIQGYDDGDPEVMDMCPSPLSGEWADDPTPATVLSALNVEIADNCSMCAEEESDIMDAYESGFRDAWWETVIQSAYAQHGEYEPCGVCKLYGHKAKDHDEYTGPRFRESDD